MNNKKKCFVIMPFSKTYSLTKEQWTEIFEHKIKPAVEESGFGYKAQRYELRRANITKTILQEINSSHLVIADLTSKNPNVLWELGVGHTLSKRTILIAQDKKFLPSDLKDYPIILYKYKQTPAEVDKFKEDIKKELEDIEADPEKQDSPVADFLQLKNIDILAYEKVANLKKLSALISELSYNINSIDDMINMVKKSEQVRKKDATKFRVAVVRFSNCCLELLISTSYIILPKELLDHVKYINEGIQLANGHLDLWGQTAFTKEIEKALKKHLPEMKKQLTSLLEAIGKLRLDYMNDNYQEPRMPPVILSSPEHEKYLEITT